jgi:NAD+ synthase
MIFGGTFFCIMDTIKVIDHITSWLRDYASKSGVQGFVVGVSGGIDSAVTSTLCALTGKKTLLLEMPIHQAASQVSRAQEHIAWLKQRHAHVWDERIELTATFEEFKSSVKTDGDSAGVALSLANTRARLRMTTLYYHAGLHRLLVAGTGNKVEDFGIGFYTKYGDGGVDISPIADLKKTEVYQIASELGIVESIMKAAPTDGLFGDNRSDEDQIGASYPELEWAMDYLKNGELKKSDSFDGLENGKWDDALIDSLALTDREKYVIRIYLKRNRANRHKMDPIPVCLIPIEMKS